MARRKRFKLLTCTILMASVSGITYLGSELFLRSYNNSLTIQTQKIEAEIEKLNDDNEAQQAVITELSNDERIAAIVEDMNYNPDNVSNLKH